MQRLPSHSLKALAAALSSSPDGRGPGSSHEPGPTAARSSDPDGYIAPVSFSLPEPADLATSLSRTDCSDDVRFAEVQAFQAVHDVAFDLEANLNLGFGDLQARPTKHGASS